MKLTYDSATDIAHIYLADSSGYSEVMRAVVGDATPDRGSVNLQFDINGHFLGFEILGASQMLRPEVLADAMRSSPDAS